MIGILQFFFRKEIRDYEYMVATQLDFFIQILLIFLVVGGR